MGKNDFQLISLHATPYVGLMLTFALVGGRDVADGGGGVAGVRTPALLSENRGVDLRRILNISVPFS